MPETIQFTDNLQPNYRLQEAVYIAHKKLRGPETIVFSPNGSIYSGLLNGQIVRIDPLTDEVFVVTQIGNETDIRICSINIYFFWISSIFVEV